MCAWAHTHAWHSNLFECVPGCLDVHMELSSYGAAPCLSNARVRRESTNGSFSCLLKSQIEIPTWDFNQAGATSMAFSTYNIQMSIIARWR